MNLSDQLIAFEKSIAESNRHPQGDAASRTVTMHRDVILYLLQEGKANINDDASVIWDYVRTYSPAALYKVANIYRKKRQLPLLNYQGENYHKTDMTIAEWKMKEGRK